MKGLLFVLALVLAVVAVTVPVEAGNGGGNFGQSGFRGNGGFNGNGNFRGNNFRGGGFNATRFFFNRVAPSPFFGLGVGGCNGGGTTVLGNGLIVNQFGQVVGRAF